MIRAGEFLDAALRRGHDFYTGVPCSFLTPLIDGAISRRDLSYVGATSEGEAVALASGAWLAGRAPVVMCQNSGLGNMVNPLTSLTHPFGIPLLLVCTWRGRPGVRDEPQHEVMGRVTHDLLDTIGIAHRPFPDRTTLVESTLEEAGKLMTATERPVALVMEKGTVAADGPLDQVHGRVHREARAVEDRTRGGSRPSRAAALRTVLARVPDEAAVIASTGKCGRELFTLADREQHFYQVGSMGCASALALGVALHTPRPVVVLDGDGAALMKLGNLATVGAEGMAGYVHVVLDNEVHDSTGGQATVSPGVDFGRIALACGYRTAAVCDELAGFAEAFDAALTRPGPHLVHVRITPGSLADLGRPTVPPYEVARRFRRFLATVL
ncbi:phosphonopyruvate decarboxylase [Streptomyces acidiscabies]|uniref:phosphonopyruvate decarboxylase n=1 Tax=Streptomyces acidiscabies TaxID=42234 RepID=UPI00095FB54A|nr:phosphonopyruvate decarboxylase [Streptomyces acidiscabies]GAV39911.1 acetolactate synthase isozyme 1 large subunit [Streptomyces acidiscabies]